MKLDRHEQYILRTLGEKRGAPVQKLVRLAEHHRLVVAYAFKKSGDTACIIFIDNSPAGAGEAAFHQEKESRNVERIGRMIAFTRAVLMTIEELPLSSEELESLARGV